MLERPACVLLPLCLLVCFFKSSIKRSSPKHSASGRRTDPSLRLQLGEDQPKGLEGGATASGGEHRGHLSAAGCAYSLLSPICLSSLVFFSIFQKRTPSRAVFWWHLPPPETFTLSPRACSTNCSIWNLSASSKQRAESSREMRHRPTVRASVE